ncbi:MAG: HAMP domain-containing sensor histidine kinase [Marinobacter sp.]
MEWLTHSQTGFQQAARYLLGMRLTIVAIQLVAIAVAETMVTLAHRGEAVILCLVYAVMATLGWLWLTRKPPSSPGLISVSLALDLLLIGGWLSLTGGYTNPLTSLLLLPIAVAIILVPLRQSIALTLCGILVYTSLVLWPMPGLHDHAESNLAQLHLVGMWVTFAVTAGILLLVVGNLARRLHRQQSTLAEVRERRLRDEQIIALGLSAASVAHRLGTPFNTMSLLIEELKQSNDPVARQQDLEMMEQQLGLCADHLKQLSAAAGQARAEQRQILTVSDWLNRLRESATLLWPASSVQWQLPWPEGRVTVDATLDQAVLNLLANALTASPSWVSVNARAAGQGTLEIVVEDRGGGFENALHPGAGSDIEVSSNGLGVGLFLSNATIQRLGGQLRAHASDKGTTMIIALPEVSDDN